MKQDKVTFNHEKIVNIYIVYEISKNINTSDYPALENCLFGVVTLTKNADIDRYKYSGYGIGFDRYGSFFISWYWIRQKCNTFWSRYEFFCTCWQQEKIYFYFLGKGLTQGLEHTLTAEKMYSINFTEQN